MPTAAVSRPGWRSGGSAIAALLAILLLLPCLFGIPAAYAAVQSEALEGVLATASSDQQVSTILYLGSRVTMDELYPVAKSLPMAERRAFVIQTLKARFNEMSSRLLPELDAAQKRGDLSHVRPLWILNAVRVTAKARFIGSLDSAFPEVEFMDSDRPHPNTLDAMGWGVNEIGAERVWRQLGVDGSGIVVGHIDAGAEISHPGFTGHFWTNPGEDLNGNGVVDAEEINGSDDDGNGYIDDFHGWDFDEDDNDVTDAPLGGGHGTKTGSVISSAGRSGCDTVSVAPGAKLMELSAFILQGAYFEASQYAISMGANLISASVSFKYNDCDNANELDCPNYVAHRRVAEMELAAGLIHSNSIGNTGGPVPLAMAAPSNCPPPALTPQHPVHAGVSSIVSVSAYNSSGMHSYGGNGPAAWSREDLCFHPRMAFCGPSGSGNEYPAEYNDYPWRNGSSPGLAKPDISAPEGVASLDIGGACGSLCCTSGATPHVGGVLALIFSAFPGITPEDAYLLLVSNTVDAGDPGYDYTWGFGKLRPFLACSTGFAHRGAIHGAVTAGGLPLAGVRVSTAETQTVLTNADGLYALSVPAGDITVRYEKYGYQTVEMLLSVDAAQILTNDVSLSAATQGTVTGVVTGGGAPLEGLRLRIGDIPLETETGPGGAYQLELYAGHYTLEVGALPWETQTIDLVITGGEQIINVVLDYSPVAHRTGPDSYGYYIYDDFDADTVFMDWVEINPNVGGLGGTNLPVGDEGILSRTLPFSFRFYGVDYSTISISANGLIIMGTSTFVDWSTAPIPSALAPNGYLAVWRADWQPQFGSVWYYADSDNHRVIVEWYDVPNYLGSARVTFQAILYDPLTYPTPTGDGAIKYQYLTATRPFESTIGIEDPDGENGVQYAYQLQYEAHAAPIESGRALFITTDSTFGIAAVEPIARPTMPTAFALAQNYPNPFNPTTTFTWSVPQAADVRLALYNVLGREVAVVFAGRQSPGDYRADFNGTTLATGLYFARLEVSGQSRAVRKVMLLK